MNTMSNGVLPMVTKYKCSECHTKFTDHEAYCENWREPDKKFGCPGCKTMFRKKDSLLQQVRSQQQNHYHSSTGAVHRSCIYESRDQRESFFKQPVGP